MVARQTRLQTHTRSHPPSRCRCTGETTIVHRRNCVGFDEKLNGAAAVDDCGGDTGRSKSARDAHGIQTGHAHAQNHDHSRGAVGIDGGAHNPGHGLHGPGNGALDNDAHHRHHQTCCRAHHPYHGGRCGGGMDARHVAVAVDIDAAASKTKTTMGKRERYSASTEMEVDGAGEKTMTMRVTTLLPSKNGSCPRGAVRSIERRSSA